MDRPRRLRAKPARFPLIERASERSLIVSPTDLYLPDKAISSRRKRKQTTAVEPKNEKYAKIQIDEFSIIESSISNFDETLLGFDKDIITQVTYAWENHEFIIKNEPMQDFDIASIMEEPVFEINLNVLGGPPKIYAANYGSRCQI